MAINNVINFVSCFRFHNDRMVNHDPSLRVSIDFPTAHSVLSIASVAPSDSGNYTCAPQNLLPASADVHILDEDSNSAAAIHTDDGETAAAANGSGRENSAAAAVMVVIVAAAFFLIRPSSC